MDAYVLSTGDLDSLLNTLGTKYTLIGCREREDQPGFYRFGRLDSPGQLVLDYGTTTIPPKKAFFPAEEELFSFALDHSPEPVVLREKRRFVLVGVHPCDLTAIDLLDAAHTKSPRDGWWMFNRNRAIIIGVDCLPDEYCFCTSMESSMARSPSDLFLTPVSRGYLVEIHSHPGKELMALASKVKAEKRDQDDAREWRLRKNEMIKTRLNAPIARLADILEDGGLTDIWKEVAERCYSCGSCNTTCPTCFCFTMIDEFDLTLSRGIRKRGWDSCQLPEFASVAGGYNFRGERWQRVKHRWHRKFLYLYRSFGRPYCTGCGRCSRACTADINIVDVTNELIAHTGKGCSNG